ncbi:TerB family tellurite resistance protein [Roseovarius aquimarinus]|uniref:TerB family tellurite resistance protein n=1 Tax=Roseovarius aquimarinus TaxID=1229156 RepID=A0ABW7I6P3_9RHOB
MSLWSRITEAVSALANGEGLSTVFERLRTPPERRVAFAIAVIALGAKMAKADGQVTRGEVSAFREVFQIARGDEAGAARVFNLARQDVAGFEEYARRIKAMFGDQTGALSDLLEGLFHIAMADGEYHPDENSFLERVAEIFDLPEREFEQMRCRFVPDAAPDPYTVLGASPEDDMDTLRTRYREMVRASHPDRMVARGVPVEAMRLAEKRMVDVNRAWERIRAERG